MGVAFLLLVVGFLGLIKGADLLVSGSSSLARKYHVPDLTIGLTIVAFGTSAPELVVNVVASLQETPALIYGNIIGSNLFNLFVILGISGLIVPITVKSTTAWREIPLSIGVVLLLLVVLNGWLVPGMEGLSRLEGLFLLGLFGAFLYYVFRQMKTDDPGELVVEHASARKIGLLIVLGLAGLIVGGKLVVDSATNIARYFHVSEKIIGLTIVAAGTSLPELVTSVVAAFRKNSDIALGNVIGSNIFNLLLVLPVSAVVRPMVYIKSFNTDLLFVAGGTLFLFVAMFTGVRKKLDRWEALVLLLAYGVYAYLMLTSEL
ncbi:MAG: calcium/sodium antiporter [Bacteroidota bacterium]